MRHASGHMAYFGTRQYGSSELGQVTGHVGAATRRTPIRRCTGRTSLGRRRVSDPRPRRSARGPSGNGSLVQTPEPLAAQRRVVATLFAAQT